MWLFQEVNISVLKASEIQIVRTLIWEPSGACFGSPWSSLEAVWGSLEPSGVTLGLFEEVKISVLKASEIQTVMKFIWEPSGACFGPPMELSGSRLGASSALWNPASWSADPNHASGWSIGNGTPYSVAVHEIQDSARI